MERSFCAYLQDNSQPVCIGSKKNTMSQNIQITLPDGSVRDYDQGITGLQIAASISEGLARNVLAAKINGQVWDATRPIT